MLAPTKFDVGRCQCWILPDGEFLYPASALLPSHVEPHGEILVPYNPVLIRHGSRLILVDSGAGALSDRTGKLPDSIKSAGFRPEEIETLVLTHCHPDHVGGLGFFPKAEVLVMRSEYDFWTAAETQRKLETATLCGLGPMEMLMLSAFRTNVISIRDRLTFLEKEVEVAEGVLVVPAPGHTPGHAAVLLSSQRQQLLFLADAILYPAQFEHPDWVSCFDIAPDLTVQTREELLDRAVTDRCLVAGFHLSGIGTATRRRGHFHWEPVLALGAAL